MTQAAHTNTDGAAAERYAAGLLGISACAETSVTTMEQDAAKVDMKFSCRHVVQNNKLLTVHAQLKSGPSYRRGSDAESITLGIDKETLQSLSGAGMPGLVIWVPPPPMDRLYWYVTDPRRPLKTPIKIPKTQYLRPSLRYDLTRVYDYASWAPISKAQTVAAISSQVMLRAKEAYKELKVQEWNNPLVGKLHITRLAWRHITRRSKPEARRTLSLRAIPYLKAFLGNSPDRYTCNFVSLEAFGSKTKETRYLMCWYRRALIIDGRSHSLLVRIREEITYPTEWAKRPLSVKDIKQVATLAAWWCKKDN